jgi:hypothetical protein
MAMLTPFKKSRRVMLCPMPNSRSRSLSLMRLTLAFLSEGSARRYPLGVNYDEVINYEVINYWET